jgi:Rps23 Pro-64 3,4-dihydroxylase Tpa1-like proline 4-hydroxylase
MQGRALKAQRNGGYGACFPWHYDNPGRPNQRAITCVLYLNPWWKEGDGGEMVFMPFLQEKV